MFLFSSLSYVTYFRFKSSPLQSVCTCQSCISVVSPSFFWNFSKVIVQVCCSCHRFRCTNANYPVLLLLILDKQIKPITSLRARGFRPGKPTRRQVFRLASAKIHKVGISWIILFANKHLFTWNVADWAIILVCVRTDQSWLRLWKNAFVWIWWRNNMTYMLNHSEGCLCKTNEQLTIKYVKRDLVCCKLFNT